MAAILAATFEWKYICYCYYPRNYVTSRKIKPVSNMIKHKLSPNWCLLQTICSNCTLWLSNIVRILLLIWKKLYVDTMKNIFNWKWPPRWLPQGLRSVGVDGPYCEEPFSLFDRSLTIRNVHTRLVKHNRQNMCPWRWRFVNPVQRLGLIHLHTSSFFNLIKWYTLQRSCVV